MKKINLFKKFWGYIRSEDYAKSKEIDGSEIVKSDERVASSFQDQTMTEEKNEMDSQELENSHPYMDRTPAKSKLRTQESSAKVEANKGEEWTGTIENLRADTLDDEEMKSRIDKFLEKEEVKDNPWAICHAQGLSGEKFEDCVMAVKRKLGVHKKIDNFIKDMTDGSESTSTEMGENTDLDKSGKDYEIYQRRGEDGNTVYVLYDNKAGEEVGRYASRKDALDARDRVSSKSGAKKDFGISGAGPTPNSLLARQDLEGRKKKKKVHKQIETYLREIRKSHDVPIQGELDHVKETVHELDEKLDQYEDADGNPKKSTSTDFYSDALDLFEDGYDYNQVISEMKRLYGVFTGVKGQLEEAVRTAESDYKRGKTSKSSPDPLRDHGREVKDVKEKTVDTRETKRTGVAATFEGHDIHRWEIREGREIIDSYYTVDRNDARHDSIEEAQHYIEEVWKGRQDKTNKMKTDKSVDRVGQPEAELVETELETRDEQPLSNLLRRDVVNRAVQLAREVGTDERWRLTLVEDFGLTDKEISDVMAEVKRIMSGGTMSGGGDSDRVLDKAQKDGFKKTYNSMKKGTDLGLENPHKKNQFKEFWNNQK